MSISALNNYTALALALATCGCAVGPDFLRPDAPKADHYNAGGDSSATPGGEQRFKTSADLPADWWRMFGSYALNKAMNEALAASPTIQSAQAALRVSQDNLRAGQGVFFPQINAGGDATREKFLPQQVGENVPGKIFNLYTLSGTVSYTLDIWGGERREVEDLRAQNDAQHALLLAGYLSLSSNLTNTVIARAAYAAQIDDVQKTVALEQEQLHYAQVQYQAGTTTYSAVLSLQTQLSATQAALPPLQQSLVQADNLLVQLSGRIPADGLVPAVALSTLKLPAELPLTLPSELVRKRPDILAAEAQLHSASARIGVATAALFPSITLSGASGMGSTDFSKLFTGPSAFWSIGSQIAAPVFHGGTLLAQRQAAIDAHKEALANYRQTVLAAFAQVATALRALDHDAQLVQAQSAALATAEQNLHLTQANYQAGLDNYLQVLSADAQYLQADSAAVQATAQRLQDTVALFAALGGGWQEPPEKK